MKTWKKWTKEELKVLEENQNKLDRDDLCNLFVGRTLYSIDHALQKIRGPRMCPSAQSLTSEFIEIFDGLMLGDGSLSLPNDQKNAIFRFKCKHILVCLQYQDIFSNEGFIFGSPDPYHSVDKSHGGNTWSIRTKVNTFFTHQYHRWYPNGEKEVPKDSRVANIDESWS